LIKSLEIENFRGIKSGNLELSPITILLGPNNSSKSTILEALFLAPNPFRKVPYFFTGPGLNPRVSLNFPDKALNAIYFLHKTLNYTGYTFLLHNYDSDCASITCKENGEAYSLRFYNVEPQIYVHTNATTTRSSQVDIRGTTIPYFGLIHSNNLRADSVYDRRPLIKETLLISPDLTKAAYRYFEQQWQMIINKKITRKVAQYASKFTRDTYRDFTMEPVIGGQLDIHAYLDDGRRIRLGDLGQGIQSYIISRILYEIVRPETLLWDDIESHLNPRILIHIADWFSELLKIGKQVILSTHSLDATKVIAGVNEENARIYLTSLEESMLKTERLTLREVEDLQKAGIDARTAEAFLL